MKKGRSAVFASVPFFFFSLNYNEECREPRASCAWRDKMKTYPCLAVLLLVAVTGCATLDPDSPESFRNDTSDPPGWYSNPPISNAFIYAAGWSRPTYKPSKARDQALKRAVSTLASYAKTFIRSETVISQDMNRTDAISLINADVEGSISNFSIVAERLILGREKGKSPPGTVYILIRIPKSELKLD